MSDTAARTREAPRLKQRYDAEVRQALQDHIVAMARLHLDRFLAQDQDDG